MLIREPQVGCSSPLKSNANRGDPACCAMCEADPPDVAVQFVKIIEGIVLDETVRALSPYTPAMPCPVLAQRMVFPARVLCDARY